MTPQKTLSPREMQLLEVLRQFGGHARNAEIAEFLDVSDETVRRAVKSLSKMGVVARGHGGVRLLETRQQTGFFQRFSEFTKEKSKIAKAVAKAVPDGATVFLDVGSTTAIGAEELRVRHNLTVVTNSTKVAHELVEHNGNRVFLLGGEMRKDELGAFGFVAEAQARRYSYDVALLSADALNSKYGFLYENPVEAELASVVLERTSLALVAMVHQKFETAGRHQGFDPSQIGRLVTDVAPGKKLAAKLERWQIDVEVAE
ncbi:Glycerol-3-phosphate regulon repressor [Ruegeria meonggei]|uniref:Glycerol-3-phosphate regulon repressor n=2 Tax=Ruegeria meonggei TaxID=1446476 RepID=A0A1X6YW01_9RHOB|nr:Glycerol-3-phosphate regulon repressor [Ruegeria meonggei]